MKVLDGMACNRCKRIKNIVPMMLGMILSLTICLIPVSTVCAADYSGGGCVRWARYRTQQVYGITLPSTTNQPSGVYGASNWWYSLPSKYPRGQVPEANCLAIWSGGSGNYGHVAYVESVNANGTITLTEGGFNSSYTYTDLVTGEVHTGVRCSSVTTMNRETKYTFLGYVYLDGTAPDGSSGGGNSSSDGSGNGSATVASQSMYRLYNPNSGEHFYTANEAEKNHLVSLGWNYEGVAWTAPVSSSTPVYRLYNPNAGDHHYTMNYAEAQNLISLGWNDEGIGWYSADSQAIVLYRLYNPNCTGAGAHHYTSNYEEAKYLISLGWNDEGTAWYGL